MQQARSYIISCTSVCRAAACTLHFDMILLLRKCALLRAAHLLPKTSRKFCLAPLSNGQAPVELRRFSYISIVVMFLAIMRQCMTRNPTIASANAASITKARNKIAGLQHRQAHQTYIDTVRHSCITVHKLQCMRRHGAIRRAGCQECKEVRCQQSADVAFSTHLSQHTAGDLELGSFRALPSGQGFAYLADGSGSSSCNSLKYCTKPLTRAVVARRVARKVYARNSKNAL